MGGRQSTCVGRYFCTSCEKDDGYITALKDKKVPWSDCLEFYHHNFDQAFVLCCIPQLRAKASFCLAKNYSILDQSQHTVAKNRNSIPSQGRVFPWIASTSMNSWHNFSCYWNRSTANVIHVKHVNHLCAPLLQQTRVDGALPETLPLRVLKSSVSQQDEGPSQDVRNRWRCKCGSTAGSLCNVENSFRSWLTLHDPRMLQGKVYCNPLTETSSHPDHRSMHTIIHAYVYTVIIQLQP